jgi:hypothetical protein
MGLTPSILNGYLSWDLYKLAKDVSEQYEGIVVAGIHDMYQNVVEDMMVPRRKKSWKFMNMYHWMSELVRKH